MFFTAILRVDQRLLSAEKEEQYVGLWKQDYGVFICAVQYIYPLYQFKKNHPFNTTEDLWSLKRYPT